MFTIEPDFYVVDTQGRKIRAKNHPDPRETDWVCLNLDDTRGHPTYKDMLNSRIKHYGGLYSYGIIYTGLIKIPLEHDEDVYY